MELFCIMCGRRWMLNKETNALAKWLEKRDQEHGKNFSISS